MSNFSFKLKPKRLTVLRNYGAVDEIRCYLTNQRSVKVLTWKVEGGTKDKGSDDDDVMRTTDLKSFPEKGWDSVPWIDKERTVELIVILYYKDKWKNNHYVMHQSVCGSVPLSTGQLVCTLDTVGKVYWTTHTPEGSDPEADPDENPSQFEFEAELVFDKEEDRKQFQVVKNKPEVFTRRECLRWWKEGYREFLDQSYSYKLQMIQNMDWALVYMGTKLLGPVSTTFLADIPEQIVSDNFMLNVLLLGLLVCAGSGNISELKDFDAIMKEMGKRESKEPQLLTNVVYFALQFLSNSLPYVNDTRLSRSGVDVTVEAITHALENMSGDCEDLIYLVAALHWAIKNRKSSVGGVAKNLESFIKINGRSIAISPKGATDLLDKATSLLQDTDFGMLLSVLMDGSSHGQAHATGLIRYTKTKQSHVLDGIEPMFVPLDPAHAKRNSEINMTYVKPYESFTDEDVRYAMSMTGSGRSITSDLLCVRLFSVPQGSEVCLDPEKKTIGAMFSSLQKARWVAPQIEKQIPAGNKYGKYPLYPLDDQAARFEIQLLSNQSWPTRQFDSRIHVPYGDPEGFKAHFTKLNQSACFQIKNQFLQVLMGLFWK